MASKSAPKPRSMKAGARNVIRSNDSASLWNVTLSPGWTEDESEVLRRTIIRFGVGNWAKIIDSGLLPGKTNAQMNLQLQRLLGQQSTSEFAGIHLDPKHVGNFNATRVGPEIRRKNNTIVNTGGKLTKEELQERKNKNKDIYGLPEHKWKNIELPTLKELKQKKKNLRQKESDLKLLKRELQQVRQQIRDITKSDPSRVEKLKQQLDQLPSSSSPLTNEIIPDENETEETPSKRLRVN